MTRQKKIRFSALILMLTALGLIFYTLFFPAQAMTNIRRSLSVFTSSVLPSLAVFSICTKILVKTGFVGSLAALPFGRFWRIFGLSPSGFAAFVCGAFAGFPTGASILASLYENGEMTSEEAESILPFCNQAGASFVVGTMGMTLFGDVRYGWILFFAQTAAALTGLLLTAWTRKKIRQPCCRERRTYSPFSAVTAAVCESAAAMVGVCGFIVFFSLCTEVIFHLFSVLPFDLPTFLPIVLSGFLEISSGMTVLASQTFSISVRVFFAGILLGFGGLCVFLQAFDRTERFFCSTKSYFFGKILTAILCPAFALLFLFLLP